MKKELQEKLDVARAAYADYVAARTDANAVAAVDAAARANA
jgi:hypothetical protein